MRKLNLEDIMKIALALEVYISINNDDNELVYSSEHIDFGEGYVKWYFGFTHDQQPKETVYFCDRLINFYDQIIKTYEI